MKQVQNCAQTPQIDGVEQAKNLIRLSKCWAKRRMFAPFIFYKVNYLPMLDSIFITKGSIHSASIWQIFLLLIFSQII